MANLHNLLNDIPFGDLPPAWTTFDLASFSRAKSLWDYQQSVLQNAFKTLWKYYKDDFVASITTAKKCAVHRERNQWPESALTVFGRLRKSRPHSAQQGESSSWAEGWAFLSFAKPVVEG